MRSPGGLAAPLPRSKTKRRHIHVPPPLATHPPGVARAVFLLADYIFQRKPTDTERPIWSVPKLVVWALPALPK